MYKCESCLEEFDEPSILHTSYESYYGVYDEFVSHNPLDLKVCPNCDCEEWYDNEVLEDDK